MLRLTTHNGSFLRRTIGAGGGTPLTKSLNSSPPSLGPAFSNGRLSLGRQNFSSASARRSAPHDAHHFVDLPPIVVTNSTRANVKQRARGPSGIHCSLIATSSARPSLRHGGAAPSYRVPENSRSFHASRPNQFPHPIVLILGLFKSSTALGVIKIVARITLSLLPVFLLKKFKIVKWLRRAMNRKDLEEIFPGKKDRMLSHIRTLNKIMWGMVAIPLALLAIAVLASVERTPITGRWRFILLSPGEEEVISSELRGQGWYTSVYDILTSQSIDQKTPPHIVPPSDWRWRWVEQTLRRLEIGIQVLHDENRYVEMYNTQSEDAIPIPPPTSHPLVPRPRASQVIHSIPPSDDHLQPHSSANQHYHHIAPHTLLGPPYSLMIVENSERNAFSYGFGADGAGGIVLYTGFLDEVLRQSDKSVTPIPVPGASSLWSSLFGGVRREQSSRAADSLSTMPSEAQTAALATLISHELAHLALSHHLETLSSGTVLVPTLSGILVDFARVIVFPFTFLFGPFVGDALADASRVGLGEVSKHGEACTSRNLELEADVVSMRLMALAGFDPHSAIDFWENRLNDNHALDADAAGNEGGAAPGSFWSPHAPSSQGDMNFRSHPAGSERVRRLREELDRWMDDRRKLFSRRQKVALEKGTSS